MALSTRIQSVPLIPRLFEEVGLDGNADDILIHLF